MTPTCRRQTFAVLVLVSTIAIAARGEALHEKSPFVTQVTDRPSQTIGGAHFTAKSNVLIFHSDADLLDNGNTVPQIFVFDTSQRILKGRRALYQLTFGAQGSFNPTATARAKSFAFDSTGDPVQNGSTGRQVFAARRFNLKHPEKTELFQVTKGAGDSFLPKLSGTGRYVVFSSTVDLRGDGLAPGEHLYRADLNALRNSACGGFPCASTNNFGLDLVSREIATGAAVHPSGKFVVFESRGDAAENGCVNGAQQLFLHDFKTGIIQQLTFGTADSGNAMYATDGGVIYFQSAADLALDGNTRTQIFEFDMGIVPPRLTQVTFGTDGDSTDPAPGPGDVRVNFTSTADLAHTGLAGVKSLYVKELLQDRFVRLSYYQHIDASLDAQYNFVIFVSDSDWVGNDNHEKHLFFLNSHGIGGPGEPTPTPYPTATATPMPGVPSTISGPALAGSVAEDNGDGTLTSVVAATVLDYYGGTVPDGIFVDFAVLAAAGATVNDGRTDNGPTAACNLLQFQARTGVTTPSQSGKAYACLTYPKTQANTGRQILATAGSRCTGGLNDTNSCTKPWHCPGGVCTPGSASAIQFLVLPPPVQECISNGLPCDDFDPCTLGDVCGGGTNTCIGGANAGAVCTSTSECASPSGGYCAFPTCQPGTATTCPNDGNPCTEDVCNSLTGLCYLPKLCPNDGNGCTDDLCNPLTGTCGIANVDLCSDGDPCTVGDVCVNGGCVSGPPESCPDDANPCTDDVCDPATGSCGMPVACVCG